ncbi:hypothetical protein niasHT_025501 [Heterodera trifolii]|uniref:Metalloendopeptidase n=1 Tax=Heterodera trifolii TaxID=157864 RepID=A0ABD2J8V2_9BILA
MNSFSLLTVFLCLVINCSAPPIRPLSSDVGMCNSKNGIILMENGCTKLLICYQSEMAKNKKIGKRFGVGKGTIGKLKFMECAEEIGEDQWHDAEPLGNELQEALSSAAFFDDFMPFVLAFDFGTKFCAENGGTTKLCKEKCLAQSLAAKTMAPTKSHGQTTITTTSMPTTTEQQTFSFKPLNKFNSRDPCDDYGEDCVPIKNLLLKIEALENCGKNESKNNAMFEMPKWAPPLPPPITMKKPSETLICDEDLFCDKQTLREQYNRLREICGLKPEEMENQRKKRQYHPYQKWTENPIKIAFNKTNLPDKYGLWDNAIRVGAQLIEEVTCVRFEFVDEMVKGQNGIRIEDTLTACGWSHVGRVGGWQYLRLGMRMFGCINSRNMSVVAGHELMHALGFDHEQSRNDTQNYVIFRKKDEQSEIDPYTQNFGFDYDFGSVMHYGAKGDHEKGLYDRITLPRFYQQTIGQRERISFKDAAIINRIYCKGN